MILNDFFEELSDALFPPLCLACSEVLSGTAHEVFCPDCRRRITYITGSHCPVCGMIFPNSPSENHLCGNCLERKPWFSSARAAVAYDGVVLDAIRRFKYGRDITTGSALATFWAGFDFDDLDFHMFDAIVPVPLHIKRLRGRGFNQSLILARALGKKHRLMVDFSLLKRCKLTLTQTGLDKKDRVKNISGAFVAGPREKIRGKNLILVDDVYTTGATINECAKTLIRTGASKVAVLTLARVL
ncbi:MAG: ComF family protein [Smithellaceae bacterium]|nr:ComF family protein [Smithellaceae bacterium]